MGDRSAVDAIGLNARRLGRTDLEITPLGFGAFKIGRNVGVKYRKAYELPTDAESDRLLGRVVNEIGINYIDTAPAYGSSEERVGRALGSRRDIIISTKVGEEFEDGLSRYDFSAKGVTQSVHRSLKRLRREALDLVFVHSSSNDLQVLNETDVVETLIDMKRGGLIRWIGMSGKTVEAADAAMAWADVLMIEFHLDDQTHAAVLQSASNRSIGVVVKKGLASGRLPAEHAIQFVLAQPAVTSMVIGGLNIDHLRDNVRIAITACAQ